MSLSKYLLGCTVIKMVEEHWSRLHAALA